MAETNGPNLCIMSIFSVTSITFLTYHMYKFDGYRCLIPRKKDWFRVLLTWMLVLSNICLLGWAGGWTYVKYKLGWVQFGPQGARPWPSALFPSPYDKFNPPLTALLGMCYALQASLNAEEGLYWYHLIRAVRRPQAATPWLGSWYFYAWVGITVAVTAVQMSVPWVDYDGGLEKQLSRELLVGGALEFIVLIAASIVVLKFPKFLKDVKASGAGPDVRSRLHFYHEANKVRTFFRFTFTIPLLLLGADGLTADPTINNNPLASDFLASILVGSLCIVMIISIMLYLPRSSSSARQNKVMVGQQMPPMAAVAHTANSPHRPHAQPGGGAGAGAGAGGFALISLLREGGQGGQWDDVEEDVFKSGGGGTGMVTGVGQRQDMTGEAPFAGAEAKPPSWSLDKEENWEGQRSVPNILENFTSPLAVEHAPAPHRPVEIRIQVEREVRKD